MFVVLALLAACRVESAVVAPAGEGFRDAVASGRAFYVSPDGRKSGTGRENDPMDLETALSHDGPVRPGDTVWLKGGTYRGQFESSLVGTETQPIVVRQVPGERATLTSAGSGEDKVLSVNGSHTWYWGFEIMSTGTKRKTKAAGCEGTDRGFGLWVWGSNNKFINLIVHDLCDGFGLWGREVDGVIEGRNAEVYGNLIYYNGVEQVPNGRGQGHGMYVTNAGDSVRILRDNIIFANFSQGIRFGDEPSVNPIIEGNIVFQNGHHLPGLKGRNIYIGGVQGNGEPIQGVIARGNLTYYDAHALDSQFEEGMNLGLWWPGGSGEIVDNYIAGGNHALKLGYEDNFRPTECRGNEIYGPVGDYVKSQCSADDNTFHDLRRPSENHVVVRPNRYEPGRANIAIYNWRMQASVVVDLDDIGLERGDRFEIRDVWNYFGRPVVSDTFNGRPVAVPMMGLRAAAMQGAAELSVQPRHTAPEFGAFVVLKR